jgi:hypothetical protein
MDDCEKLAWLLCVLILLCMVIHVRKKNSKDTFVSPEAIKLCNKSKEIFSKNDKTPFTDFKQTVGGSVDVVQYDDIRRLYKEGNLTPEGVQSTL